MSTKTAGSRKGAGAAAGRPRAAAQTPAPAPPVKPGLFAPAGEKALYKLLRSGGYTVADLEAVASQHQEQWLAAASLAALKRVEAADTSDATVGVLRQVLDHSTDPAADPFVRKYLTAGMTIGLAPGVSVELPLSHDLIGLALAEILQERGEIEAAIEVVEGLTPTAHAAVSLAELYSEAGRDDQVLELTNGVTNDDDATALLLAYRGIAFTRQRLYEAARVAFKEALKSKKRPATIRHLALRHRAEAYAADGKKAMARKDLERILAEDATVPGVRQRVTELS